MDLDIIYLIVDVQSDSQTVLGASRDKGIIKNLIDVLSSENVDFNPTIVQVVGLDTWEKGSPLYFYVDIYCGRLEEKETVVNVDLLALGAAGGNAAEDFSAYNEDGHPVPPYRSEAVSFHWQGPAYSTDEAISKAHAIVNRFSRD